MEVADRMNTLAPGDMLGCYRIDGLLGKGGFGLTYLAFDTSLEMSVAIKEYMPEQFASRAADDSVRPKSLEQRDIFVWGLERFTSEARTLAKFRHPNIVRVLGVFEQNRTAYMVMEHERGVELRHLIGRPEFRTETSLKRLVGPVMDGLEEIHRHDYIHRDIKPANILIRDDGTPVLLDFGSARLATGAQTQALTSLVSGGYAPLEQYDKADDNQQGPWTDIYALGAVLYFSVTGDAPAESTLRGWAVFKDRPDPLVSLRRLSPQGYSPTFCKAIDWALQLEAADRPQSVGAWRRRLLSSDESVPGTRRRRDAEPLERTVIRPATTNPRARVDAGLSRRPVTSGRAGAAAVATPTRGGVATAGGGRTSRGRPSFAPDDSSSRWPMVGGVVLSLLLVVAAGAVTRERWLPGVIELVSPGSSSADASRAGAPEAPSVPDASPGVREGQAASVREAEEERLRLAEEAETERRETAAREAEERRLAEEAEIERRETAAREAEERRLAEEAEARRAEEEREAAARQAEAERREAAARQAERQRLAEEEREAAARLVEETRAEAEAGIDPTRRISEADLNVVTGRFNALRRAIQQKDKAAMRQLTLGSARKYAYFDYLFDTFETIDVAVSGVQASRRDQTVKAVLELRRMVRGNGNIALPPSEFREIPLQSIRQGEWSDIRW